jgi:S1-C subfamily serine protease
MLYYGGTLEMRPDGQWGLADFPVVTRVDSGSVSARGGFRLGDVLLTVNGRDARDARPFRLRPGEVHWVVRVRRGNAEQDLTMEVPAASGSASGGLGSPRR